MKRFALAIVLAILVVSVTGSIVAADAKSETMTGTFVWNNEGQTGDLKATFTETGDGTWDAVFHFDWEGEPRVFSGSAEGSFSGALEGSVTTDGPRKGTFVFSGTFADGTFTGTHSSMRDGEASETGTMTLTR